MFGLAKIGVASRNLAASKVFVSQTQENDNGFMIRIKAAHT